MNLGLSTALLGCMPVHIMILVTAKLHDLWTAADKIRIKPGKPPLSCVCNHVHNQQNQAKFGHGENFWAFVRPGINLA